MGSKEIPKEFNPQAGLSDDDTPVSKVDPFRAAAERGMAEWRVFQAALEVELKGGTPLTYPKGGGDRPGPKGGKSGEAFTAPEVTSVRKVSKEPPRRTRGNDKDPKPPKK